MSVGGRSAAGYEIPSFLRQKFTGKERDEAANEAGLDYFLARYYSSPQGRFLTPDAPFADQQTADPQSWNLYTYGRNSPLKYIDPTGREIVGSGSHGEVVMEENDFTELVGNIAAGMLAGAINFVSDTINYNTGRLNEHIGTNVKQIPFIAPENETQANFMQFGETGIAMAIPGPKGSKGTKGETAAAAYGRQAHSEFGTKVKAKPGWKSEPSLKDPATGKTVKPDAVTNSGRPVELKPSTPSGRAAGRKQLKKYERATGKKGRVVYYKSETAQN